MDTKRIRLGENTVIGGRGASGDELEVSSALADHLVSKGKAVYVESSTLDTSERSEPAPEDVEDEPVTDEVKPYWTKDEIQEWAEDNDLGDLVDAESMTKTEMLEALGVS